ncbi:hypothetical protein ACFY3U_07635 [Micromonospora sp. NPDC000089]|uniref:hypothetical protein n=1 Tax=unclassified Micromonospora TaxID=2617518 RepID=UPI00368E07C5
MIFRAPRALVVLGLVPLLAACSAVGDIRREPAPRPSTSPRAIVPGPSPEAEGVELRRFEPAIAGRHDSPYVEFTDRSHGWALFGSCGGQPPSGKCPAQLFLTLDGGRTWSKVRHPRPTAPDQQLYAAPGLVAIWLGEGGGGAGDGWYVSADGGASFTHSSQEPAVWRAAQGRFQVAEATGRVAEWDGRKLRTLPAQPRIPALNTVAQTRDILVAAGADGRRPYAAISGDQGRSWQTTPLPAQVGEVDLLRVVVAPDGEPWLIGERADRLDFPALWRWFGRWVAVPAARHPAQVKSVVPVGGGRLAVTGPDGVGAVIEGRYDPIAWPLTPDHYLTVLADGTVQARGPQDVLLGTGSGTTRKWARVVLLDS